MIRSWIKFKAINGTTFTELTLIDISFPFEPYPGMHFILDAIHFIVRSLTIDFDFDGEVMHIECEDKEMTDEECKRLLELEWV